MKNKPLFMLGMVSALFTLAADQLSKWVMLEVVRIAERPPIEVTSFFNLVMVWNHGISFGMLSGQRMPLVLIALAMIVVVVLLRWLATVTDRMTAVSIGLVIGGALGNVMDRARFGAVADFLDFHVAGVHWPAFNIADSAICVGVVVLCLESIMRPSPKDKP